MTKRSEDAVLLSVHIPALNRLDVLREWLDTLVQKGFVHYDIYVGVNPSPVLQQVTDILTEYRPKFTQLLYDVTPVDLVVDSDVSGYQTALRLLKNVITAPEDSKSQQDTTLKPGFYRLVWFGHTKGSGNALSPQSKAQFQNEFWGRREHATKLMLADDKIGTWSPWISVFPGLQNPWTQFMDCDLPMLNVWHVYTFLVMKGAPLQQFLQATKPSFFKDNLPGVCLRSNLPQGGNRYLFEIYLGNIAFVQGYIGVGDSVHINAGCCAVNGSVHASQAHIDMLVRLQREGKPPSIATEFIR